MSDFTWWYVAMTLVTAISLPLCAANLGASIGDWRALRAISGANGQKHLMARSYIRRGLLDLTQSLAMLSFVALATLFALLPSAASPLLRLAAAMSLVLSASLPALGALLSYSTRRRLLQVEVDTPMSGRELAASIAASDLLRTAATTAQQLLEEAKLRAALLANDKP